MQLYNDGQIVRRGPRVNDCQGGVARTA